MTHRQRQPQALQCATVTAQPDIEALNKEFGIPEHVEIKAGKGGLPVVHLQHSCGASAEVLADTRFIPGLEHARFGACKMPLLG